MSIIPRSDALCASVEGLNTNVTSKTEKTFSGRAYHTTRDQRIDSTFKIIEIEAETLSGQQRILREESPEDEAPHEPVIWWRPFPLSLLSRSIVIGLPLALIIILQILFWYSSSHVPSGLVALT